MVRSYPTSPTGPRHWYGQVNREVGSETFFTRDGDRLVVVEPENPE